MQSSVGNGGSATVPRMKRTVSAPGTPHSYGQRRSWRPPETLQARQTRNKTLPVVLENEIDDFNMLQVSTSPPQATPASVEKTRKAMQATLALLKKSTSTPTLTNQSSGKEQQLPVPRLRKPIDTRENGLSTPKTPNKQQLRRRNHKAAITATNIAHAHAAAVNVTSNGPSTPTASRLNPPTIPTSAPLSAPAAISRPNQPTNISIPKRTPSSNFLSSVGSGGGIPSPSPRTVSAQSYSTVSVATPTPSAAATDPEPFRSSRNVSANDMVHAYYTILRERDPAHYLLNLNEEEEEIISQSQYAALLKLACQKFKRGDGRDRVALAYAEEMIGGGGEEDGGW